MKNVVPFRQLKINLRERSWNRKVPWQSAGNDDDSPRAVSSHGSRAPGDPGQKIEDMPVGCGTEPVLWSLSSCDDHRFTFVLHVIRISARV